MADSCDDARGNPANMLRVVICGARGEGKSTLLDRLINDLSGFAADDRPRFVDGLSTERGHGTIDLSWHYFESSGRKLIIADAPGDRRHVHNMVSAASLADVAVVVAGADTGVLARTRQQCLVATLMGVRKVIFVVNRMDLVGYSEVEFSAIFHDFAAFASAIDLEDVIVIPVSAMMGVNVINTCNTMPWYEGPALLEELATAGAGKGEAEKPFRIPVQLVGCHGDNRSLVRGTIASGNVTRGMDVQICPVGRKTAVRSIVGPSGPLQRAEAGQSVTIELADGGGACRGDMLASPSDPPSVADRFAAHLVWMDLNPMLPERSYEIRLATATANARVSDLVHVIDMDTLKNLSARRLEINQVGYCKLSVDRPLAFDSYEDNRMTGGFLLIDRSSNSTSGAGVIRFALRKGANTQWQTMTIGKTERASALGQSPRVIWLTGLSASGKTTVANRLECKLHDEGVHTYLVDGDNVRHGLNHDLGFTDADRVENVRRIAEVAKLMVDAGLVVIVSLISPFRAERQMARELVEEGEFIEVYIDTPLSVCEQRDPKGLYRMARCGELVNFTGIDSPYEIPENPEIVLAGAEYDPDELADSVLAHLECAG